MMTNYGTRGRATSFPFNSTRGVLTRPTLTPITLIQILRPSVNHFALLSYRRRQSVSDRNYMGLGKSLELLAGQRTHDLVAMTYLLLDTC